MKKYYDDKTYNPKQQVAPSDLRQQPSRSAKINPAPLNPLNLIPEEKSSDGHVNLLPEKSNLSDGPKISDSDGVHQQHKDPESNNPEKESSERIGDTEAHGQQSQTPETHSKKNPSPSPDPSDSESSDSDSDSDSNSSTMSQSSIKNDVILSDNNWRAWALRMSAHLSLRDLWIDPKQLFANQTAEVKDVCKKAYHHIILAVDDTNLELISATSNSIDAWNILLEHHAKPTMVNKVSLVRSIVNQKLTTNTTMQQHIVAMQRSFNELKLMGDGLSDGLSVALLLTSLSDDYESLVTGFQSWDENNLTMNSVGSALIDAYNRKQATLNSSGNVLSLVAKGNRQTNFEKNPSKGSRHMTDDRSSSSNGSRQMTDDRSSSSKNDRPAYYCAKCGKRGHHAENCRKFQFNKSLNRSYQENSTAPQHARPAANDEPERSMFADSVAYSTGFQSCTFSSRAVQRDNRKHYRRIANRCVQARGNQKQKFISSKDINSSVRRVYIKEGQEVMKSVIIEVAKDSITAHRKGSELKLIDNNDSDAEVEYRIGDVSPSSLSIEDVTDDEIELHLNDNDRLIDNPLGENKEHGVYLSKTFHSENTNKKNHRWIVDSGASTHMCHDKFLFQKFVSANLGMIRIADGNNIPIEGSGTVVLYFQDDQNQHSLNLENVAFVPNLDTNLLSVKKLVETGKSISFESLFCFIHTPDERILLATFINSAYQLSQLHLQHQMAAPCVHEWHKRFAHRNIADIKRLKDFGLPIQKCSCADECVPCIEGKLPAKPFPKHSEKPDNCLDVVACDLCGPMQTESIGRSQYFITFTDVHSDYTEIRCIRNKSDAKQCVIDYIERLKNSLNKKPKVFRSDRGGEFTDAELQSYLRKEGIKFESTVHDSPQQNGIAERKNRTLCDAVRTMLISAELPPSFWAEALNNAVYTFNRITRKHQQLSPFELFFNKKTKGKFAEFGHHVFVTTKQQGRNKFDKRAVRMRFLSVDDQSKGFRVWDGRIVRVERNLKFSNSTNVAEVPYIDPSLTNQPPELTKLEIDAANENKIEIPLRRSQRILERNEQLVANSSILFEPQTFKQAINCSEKGKWEEAMKEELDSIEKNNTWSLVDLPKDRKAIGCKWVFKVKRNENGQHRYKARLVAQGFTQKYGVDYDEVFAPVARSETFRILMAMAGKEKLCVRQFDVKTAFLNGNLIEEIYMRQPKGFNKGTKVLKLHKSLYGLKQAARVWNLALHNTLTDIGFVQSKADHCLYVLRKHCKVCYLIIHVDDMLFAATDKAFIEEITCQIMTKFELKDLGDVKHFLGIDVHKSEDGMFSISQAPYIDKIAHEFGQTDANAQKFPLDPGYYKLEDENMLPENNEYRKIIGMLLYISRHSRPDISASVCILSQKLKEPRELDLSEAKRVIRYLKATKHLKLHLSDPATKTILTAFSDANWAEDKNDRKSNTGFICFLFGGAVAWSSRKQDVVSVSTTEAEFYALAETVKEVQWIVQLLRDFKIYLTEPVVIEADSQSCIKFVENEKFSNRTKHIDVRYHFVKEVIGTKLIELKHCPTEFNIADMLTKPLAGTKIKALRELGHLTDTR